MQPVKHSILIVDDEAGQRQLLRVILEKEYSVTSASSGREAVQLLSNRGFDLVVTDQRMPEMDGLQLIAWMKENVPEIPVIILTAFGSIDSAVEAMKRGAEDYLTKPLKNPDELRITVNKALSRKGLVEQEQLHREETERAFTADVIAESPQMKRVLTLTRQVAAQSTTVLVTGESGTGKEVIARLLHKLSARSEGPFVAVNCAALAENLLESELFGHEKGAFTGATQSRQGRFELAHGGTLFLDEIGEMGPNLQSKLLRVLQEQQFERVGGNRTIAVDVRVVAATNRDLKEALQEGTFREDLFYRLSVFPVELPPLRERREDILPLAAHFVGQLAARMGKQVHGFSREVAAVWQGYAWPGNIRELRNVVERALIICDGNEIQLEHLQATAGSTSQPGHPETLAELEKEAILRSLERNGGDRKATADELGISLRTLQYRLKEYGATKR